MSFMLPEEYLVHLPAAEKYVDDLVYGHESALRDAPIKPQVYIAGPFSHPYPVYNTRRAMAWGFVLEKSQFISACVPHLTHFEDMLFPRPYQSWLEKDKQALYRSDVLFRLEGESSGADGELQIMQELDMPIFYEKDYVKLIEYSRDWIKDNNAIPVRDWVQNRQIK